jgi:glycosyltransferase involved in cell wall biosynthesis
MTGAIGAGPLHVALLNFCYWPEVRRGTERVMHDLATGLAAGGHRAQILTSHPGRPTRTVEDDVEVVRSWRPPDYPLRVRRLGEHLTHLPFSYRALQAGGPDVAHAFHASDALASLAWARRTGRPAVLSWMGLMAAGWQSYRALRLETVTRTVYGSDALVVLSRTARDSIWRWMGIEGRIIYPGVDIRHFTPGGERDERPTIVCAAAPDAPEKRVGLLVRAFAHVRRERPAARLVLMRPKDAALARELSQEGVELSDAGSDEVVHLYRSAWVSALPSINEAFGLVIVEALACGTPGVASTGFGPAEILDRPEVGRLFDGDDEHALARALLEALELAQEPGTAEACMRRASAFTVDAATAEHEALYRELLAR